ncbi:hypothetical protein Hanom_Chr10g00904511 [Helianthus anomalus]
MPLHPNGIGQGDVTRGYVLYYIYIDCANIEAPFSINTLTSHTHKHTHFTSLSLPLPLLPLGREPPHPHIHCRFKSCKFQVYSSVGGHVQRSSEQTEREGPLPFAIIHAVFD